MNEAEKAADNNKEGKEKKSNISINEMTGNEQKMKGGMAFAAAPPRNKNDMNSTYNDGSHFLTVHPAVQSSSASTAPR